MVRSAYLNWNTFEPSILTMYEKLIALSFTFYGEKVAIIESLEKS